MEHCPFWEANSHWAFYGTWRFIIMFTRTHYWTLSWITLIQSTTSHPVSLRSILISSHVHLGLPSGLFPSGLPTISPKQAICPCPSYAPWLVHPNSIWWSVQVMKLHNIQFSLVSHHFLPNILTTLFSNIHNLYSSLNVETKSHTHTKQHVKL